MSKDVEFFCYAGSMETKVPLSIIRGIVLFESEGGNLLAENTNPDGTIDKGPGQLNSKYIAYFEQKFNQGRKIYPYEAESILITARILAWNYRRLGDWERAITAYKWGVDGTRDHGVDKEYVWNVLNMGGYCEYRSLE